MRTFICILTIAFITSIHAQHNKEITTDDGRQFLLGKITLEGLQTEPYKSWYEMGLKQYAVDETLAELFKERLQNYKIRLFLGTWCGDSKREVPRFIKILKHIDFPLENLEIVALDRRKEHYKTSPDGEEKGLNIVKVPTMIFLKDGLEVNRIIERPVESLEEDINSIVTQNNYVPNYAHQKRTR